MRIAIIMDPIESINIAKDTTFAMLIEAQTRGFDLWYCTAAQLFFAENQARAMMHPIAVHPDPTCWFTRGDAQVCDLKNFDVILMRKDPPFDINYIYATYFLDHAKKDGCLVINDPSSLRDCNEKLFITWFPEWMPPTLVSSQRQQIRDFHHTHQDIICKPLDGMGGAFIFRVKPDGDNLNVIIETLTDQGRRPCMIQRYLPQIAEGDKRILMINGEPVPYTLARIPSAGDLRGNLAAGGQGKAQPLSQQEEKLARAIGPTLKKRGLFFVGVDVIGEYITEINVTSPTCVQEISKQSGYPVMQKFFDALSAKSKDNRRF